MRPRRRIGAALRPEHKIRYDRLSDPILVRRAKDGVRLLAKGEIKSKVELVVYGASAAAIKAVEKAGGKVTVTKPVAAEAAAE